MNMERMSIIRVLLICLSGFYFSCGESIPKLPPETQTGENTFGCLVNNELVLVESEYQAKNAGANYNRENDQLQITAQCQFGQQFVFFMNDPYKIQDVGSIDTIRYLPPNASEWMEATQTGSFSITRLDSGIVSGTFSFDLNENGKAPIHVTKGRFDLTLNTY